MTRNSPVAVILQFKIAASVVLAALKVGLVQLPVLAIKSVRRYLPNT
ncbi:MAG: hypothetical protein IPG23_05800 [Burkholderiales bacterium]|nr:hypothetical protein [Burkholderiales bacterium]